MAGHQARVEPPGRGGAGGRLRGGSRGRPAPGGRGRPRWGGGAGESSRSASAGRPSGSGAGATRTSRSRRARSSRARPTSRPLGLSGTPWSGHCRAAASSPSRTASSQASKSPWRRTSVPRTCGVHARSRSSTVRSAHPAPGTRAGRAAVRPGRSRHRACPPRSAGPAPCSRSPAGRSRPGLPGLRGGPSVTTGAPSTRRTSRVWAGPWAPASSPVARHRVLHASCSATVRGRSPAGKESHFSWLP